MGKIAFAFSGQGAQYSGMGKELYERYDAVKSLYDSAEEIRPGTKKQSFEGTAEELKQTEFTGEAANGAVKVVITGGHECRSIKIDPKVVDPEDIEMLEDLVMLAFNNAQQTCRTESEAAMNKAVPLPAGMKLPF